MQAIIDDGVKAIISITAAVDVLNAGLLRPTTILFPQTQSRASAAHSD